MTQETIRVPNGIITISHVDKTFLYEGKETFMEFSDKNEVYAWVEQLPDLGKEI